MMTAQTFAFAVIVGYVIICDHSLIALGRHYSNSETQPKNKKNYDKFRTCVETSKCEKLSPAKCFGTSLKYTHTAIGTFVPTAPSSLNSEEEVAEWGADTQRAAHEKLEKWAKYLRHFPACWKKVQKFLCAMYLPPCVNDTVQVPSLRLCEEINVACAIIEKTWGWPSFLQCFRQQRGQRFPSSCTNRIESMVFNTTSACVAPLITNVKDSDSWYEETECGLQCRDPLFKQSELDRVSVFIFVLAVLCLMTTGFTLFTFIIDWKKANFYPPLVLFYLNLSFFAGTWGWMAQFFPGSKNDIVCRKDSTIRHSEPKNETQSCLVVFFIIYYSFLSGLIWFVILSFCWYLNYQKGRGDLTKLREYLRGKTAYFHLAAWSVPLVLCIIISGMSKLDGDYLAGVCFMGYRRRGSSGVWMPIFFVLLPMLLAASASGFFIFRGVRVLLFIQKNPTGSSSSSSHPKRQVLRISRVMTRMGIFSFFALLIVVTSFGCHFYIFFYQADWEQSLRQYVVCRAASSGANAFASPKDPCFPKVRPNVSILQLHIFCYFAAGMLMSLWVWNARSLTTWKQFFRRLRKCGKKDKAAIATSTPEAAGAESMALARRRQDLSSTPANGPELTPFVSAGGGAAGGDGSEDPIGMGWELNSVTTASQISSTWAIPNFILRGRGLPPQTPVKADSSASISDGLAAASRQRRLSMDSHASQSSQTAAAVAVAARGHRRNAHALRKRRMHRPPLNELTSAYKRRNSDTSASSLALSGGVQGHALHPLRKSLSNSQNSLFQETSFISAQGIGSARSLFTRSASELNSGMESDRNSILNVAASHHGKRGAHRNRKESGASKGAETENESITGGPWGMNGFPGFSPHLPFMNDPYWASQLGGGTGIPGYPYGGAAGNPFAALFPPGMTDFGPAFGMPSLPFGAPNLPPHVAAMSAMMGMAGMSAPGAPMFGASSLGDSAYPPSVNNINPPRRQISGHIPGKGSSVSEAVMAQADVSGSENELASKGKAAAGATGANVAHHRHGRTTSRAAATAARGEKGAAGRAGGPLAVLPPNGFTSLADVVAMQMAIQAQEAVQSATASQAAAAENPLSNMTVCPMQQNMNVENQQALLASLPPSMFTSFNMQHQQQKLFGLGAGGGGGVPGAVPAGTQPLSTSNLNTMNMSQAQQIAAVQQQQMQAAAQQQFQMMAMHHQMMMAAAAAAAAQQQTQNNVSNNPRSGSSKAPSILGAPGKHGNIHLDPNANLKNGGTPSSSASAVAKRKGPEKGSFRRSQSRQSKPTNSSFESIATE